MEHRFKATIERSGDMDAAYVVVPIDIRKEYGKGRLKVEATFDGEPYSGNICYIIGITKAIRQRIGKNFGDSINITLRAI